ncbi:MAG: hypothetical protein L3J99_02815 [Thermoplasmata archaeon]|nr:hypothetical protein [Thermoplasmata archaeon]
MAIHPSLTGQFNSDVEGFINRQGVSALPFWAKKRKCRKVVAADEAVARDERRTTTERTR